MSDDNVRRLRSVLTEHKAWLVGGNCDESDEDGNDFDECGRGRAQTTMTTHEGDHACGRRRLKATPKIKPTKDETTMMKTIIPIQTATTTTPATTSSTAGTNEGKNDDE